METKWYHFTVSRVGQHDDGEPWADVCAIRADNEKPELENPYARKLTEELYDIPNAGMLWEGWVMAENTEDAESKVEDSYFNRKQKNSTQYVGCSLDDTLTVHTAEHQTLLSFADDANNVAFQEWWENTGHKEFSKFWQENKETYK